MPQAQGSRTVIDWFSATSRSFVTVGAETCVETWHTPIIVPALTITRNYRPQARVAIRGASLVGSLIRIILIRFLAVAAASAGAVGNGLMR